MGHGQEGTVKGIFHKQFSVKDILHRNVFTDAWLTRAVIKMTNIK